MPGKPTATFIAPRFLNLRLVRTSAVEQILPQGGVTVVQPEKVYEFKAGFLQVRHGDDMIADAVDEEKGALVPQDAVQYLRNHPENGLKFTEEVAVAPDPGLLYAQLTDAMIAGDLDKIMALGNEELASWNRPEVMERLKDARAQLEAKTEPAKT